MNIKKSLSILTNGIIRENPAFVLILGTCPTLAVSTMAINGVGMGLAATFTLICSNMAISALKNIISPKVRIPCYIVLIAGFVTIIQFILKAYMPEIDKALGIFLPLIVVNCIILARAEMFASKNTVKDSFLDGLGMGTGFTFALFVMGSIREVIGAGTWFGLPVNSAGIEPVNIFLLAPGGFFVSGTIIAAVNHFAGDKAVKRKSFGCEGCPAAISCDLSGSGGCEGDKQ